jgi:hypothetical protein
MTGSLYPNNPKVGMDYSPIEIFWTFLFGLHRNKDYRHGWC